MTKRELVEQAQRGDPDAFAALTDATVARLDAAARLMLRDGEAARDAVQDAYFRAWRDLRSLRDPDLFDRWLHRLLANACRDQLRRSHRRPIEVDLAVAEHPTTADEYASWANRDEIERGFRSLKPEQRAVIVLHYYLGLPVPEAAATLGIPLGTAKSRLHHSLQALRAAIEADARGASAAPEGRLA